MTDLAILLQVKPTHYQQLSDVLSRHGIKALAVPPPGGGG